MRMAPTTVLPYVRYWPLIAGPSDCLDQPNAAAVNRARRASESFPPIGATIGLFRITDGRPYDTVRREFAAAHAVRSCSRISATCARTIRVPADGEADAYAAVIAGCRRFRNAGCGGPRNNKT
jgi:hypothetical protein